MRRSQTGRRSAHAPRERRHVLPLHHRIYMVLRQRLLDGAYESTQPLPGEHKLAEEFKASRVTIRRVLQQLVEDTLIVRRHGSGTYPLPARRAPQPAREMSYYDYIAASSHNYDDKLLAFEALRAPAFLAEIDAHFGSQVLRIVRVAYRQGVPQHILRTYVPGDLAQYLSRRSIGNKTVIELLKRHGVLVENSELRIGATIADTFEAQHLRVRLGAPLLHATRISRLSGGRAIEYHEMLSVAELFGYRFCFDWRVGAVKLPAPQ